MAEEGLLYGDRTWFVDPRGPARRMGVANHADHGLVILSLWAGDTCTATFRMPVADAARMIGVLADGLAAAIPEAEPVTVPPASRGWRARLAGLADRFRGRGGPGPTSPTDPTAPDAGHLKLVR
jgi:hypothetical protein